MPMSESVAVGTVLKKIDLEHSSRPEHGKALCWAARIVSLLPGIGATAYVSIDTASWAAKYGDVWDIFQTVGMSFFILVLPALVGWRWHLAGGLIMMLESSVNILMIANSIATNNPYAYFEADPSYVLRAILPMWVTILVGSCLHLMAWARETRT